MRLALSTCVILLLAGCSGPEALLERPYDFRGISLGISQAELRQLPWPGEDEHVHFICTGDRSASGRAYAYVEIEGPLAEIGVTRCAYEAEQGSPYYPGTAGLNMGGGRYVSHDHAFWFIADPEDQIARLYAIDLPTNVDAAYNVLSALNDRFGEATTSETTTLQNGFGATFQGTIQVWRNSVSSITVRAPDEQLDKMRVAYLHTRLSAHVNELLERRQRAIPDRM